MKTWYIDDRKRLVFNEYLLPEIEELKKLIEQISNNQISANNFFNKLISWKFSNDDICNTNPYNEILNYIFSYQNNQKNLDLALKDITWILNKIPNIYEKDKMFISEINRLINILEESLTNRSHEEEISVFMYRDEINKLKNWCYDNTKFSKMYPYDMYYWLLEDVIEDKKMDYITRYSFRKSFNEFFEPLRKLNKKSSEELKIRTVNEVCEHFIRLKFNQKTFSIVGCLGRVEKNRVILKITELGGIYEEEVTKETNYIVCGENNSELWEYSYIGRKIIKGLENIKKNYDTKIITERRLINEIKYHNEHK
jgi:hypothetical protein